MNYYCLHISKSNKCVACYKSSNSKELWTIQNLEINFTLHILDDKKPLATAYPEPQNDPPPAVEGDGEAEENPAAPTRPAMTTSVPIGLYLF